MSTTRLQFAAFTCTECEYTFAGCIPLLFEDLPRCPVCDSASQIEDVLVCRSRQTEQWVYHTHHREVG